MAGPLRNLRWETFARLYASGETLEASYRAAFTDSGKFARFNASRLSHKPQVRERINELLEQFSEASAVKIEYLQAQLLQVFRVNAQDLFDEKGQLKPIPDLPREVAAAIKTVRFDRKTGELAEIQLTDRMAAAGHLLRSIMGPDTTASANVTLELGQRLDRALTRAKVIDASPVAPRPITQQSAASPADKSKLPTRI